MHIYLYGKVELTHPKSHIKCLWVDNLFFENLVGYFRKQDEKDRLKGLACIRFFNGVNAKSNDIISMNQKTIIKVTNNVYKRRTNQIPCATCNNRGHLATTCLVGKPCEKCGKKGRLSRLCWQTPFRKKRQEGNVIYEIDLGGALSIDPLVPLNEALDQPSSSSHVNAMSREGTPANQTTAPCQGMVGTGW